jgi:PAS domain S-box-containing protein
MPEKRQSAPETETAAASLLPIEQDEARDALIADRRVEQMLLQGSAEPGARVEERTLYLVRSALENLRLHESVLREVEVRRLTEEALCASEERWRSLVAGIPDIVWVVNRDLRITFMNHVPERSRLTLDQTIGLDFLGYVAPDYRHMARTLLVEVFATARPTQYDVPVPQPSGEPVWWANRVAPIRNPDGTVDSAIVVSRDVTDRKRVEQLKDAVIHDVAHELRAPLAKMLMSLDLLEETLAAPVLDTARVRLSLDLAKSNSRRMLGQVEGILDLAALEAGCPLDLEEVQLDDLIYEAVAELGPLAERRGLALSVDLPQPLCPVLGDRQRLLRVMLNLIGNAVKFTEQGQVVASAFDRGSEVEVAVCDTGQGFEPQNSALLFDRFYQETPGSTGVGLGLSICRAIVAAHGGRIWAETPGRGRGAVFRFTLPLMDQLSS